MSRIGRQANQEAGETSSSGLSVSSLNPSIGLAAGEKEQPLLAHHGFEEQRYRTLFEHSAAGGFVASADGRILRANDEYARMLICRHDEQTAHYLAEIFADEAGYERFMTLLRESGCVTRTEVKLRRFNSEVFWALTNASMLRTETRDLVIEGSLIEITGLKDAESSLRMSEDRFRTLVERSADAISLVDREGRVIYSSHAVSPIFGYTLAERVGKNIFELVHPEDRMQTIPLFEKLIVEPKGASVSAMIRYRHKSGSWRWIEALATNLLEDPSVHAVVINYRDVTDRRLLEQQFHQAQKMEAIGRLAGGVAHDFNNLLTAILGYSDMALEKLPPNSQAKRYTAEIKKAGERAALLTRQLLAYSRLQVMSPQVIDLNAVIVEMSKMLRRLAGEDIVLATIPNASPGRIKSDPSQIEQVIMNLAVNARDAMPQGGKLTIKTSDSVLEDMVTAEGLRVKGGHYVQLDVSDTGCGMDAETRARIFDPFFTTKERGKGTGLGLSTVYGIVKQSSGYIWVNSEPSRGTTFSIYLPAVAGDLSEEKPAGARAQKHCGTETILVVEDEDSVRQVLGKILAGMGYQVITAPRGGEALEICEQHKHAIHLMLTDIAMPRMKGQELARRVAKIHPETKVLFMTGYAGNKVGAIDVLETGSYFLSKPFTAEALGQMVRRILGRTR